MKKLYTKYRNIWHCFNPSGDLKQMSIEIKKHLKDYKYDCDIWGNIFVGDFTKNRPCLVAHIDSVHRKKSTKFTCKHNILKSNNGIGGDDKCGIIAILELLKYNKNTNVIFTIDEEIGGVGASKITSEKLKNVMYYIEIDRQGNKDIIFHSGMDKLASDEFQAILKPYMLEFNYKEDFGTFTDINILTQVSGKSGINISAGYYKAHTTKEYVNLLDLQKTILFVNKIINTLKQNYILSIPSITNKTSSIYHIDDILTEIYTLGYDDKVVNLVLKAYYMGLDESMLLNI